MTLISGAAHAQSADFVLANNTEFTVYSVHFWPTVTETRGPDRLGDATLRSGATHVFSPSDSECSYNIRVKLADNDYEKQWNSINLCKLRTFTLNYNYVTGDLWASKD